MLTVLSTVLCAGVDRQRGGPVRNGGGHAQHVLLRAISDPIRRATAGTDTPASLGLALPGILLGVVLHSPLRPMQSRAVLFELSNWMAHHGFNISAA